MAFPHFFNPLLFATETFFTTIAVVFCFIIYFKTREIYNLTRHEGVKYFRESFLFFGLSYFLRFLLSMVFLSRMVFDLDLPRNIFVPLFILPLGYFSTIGIFYLVSGSIWKGIKKRNLLLFGHGLAILLSIVSLITRSPFILLIFQSLLLILGAIISIIKHKKEKKVSKVRILYLLVSFVWLLNLWIVDRPRRPLFFEGDIIAQIVSLAVFVAIYLKISKWVR